MIYFVKNNIFVTANASAEEERARKVIHTKVVLVSVYRMDFVFFSQNIEIAPAVRLKLSTLISSFFLGWNISFQNDICHPVGVDFGLDSLCDITLLDYVFWAKQFERRNGHRTLPLL